MKKLRIGIVGAGRMGRVRARTASRHPDCELVEVVDTNLPQAQTLAAEFGCAASSDWTGLLDRKDGKEIDAVVVATPHKHLAPISAALLQAGKHVLCEKPGARTSAEAEMALRVLYGAWPPADPMEQRQQVSAQIVIGFTLRHHPAILRAREMVAAGEIGRPMYVLGRYGHGGRPGYEQEWRSIREQAGGGELLDQGVHLIDLSRWFLGEFQEVSGFVGTYFWRAKHAAVDGAVEDNAFLLMRSAEGYIASLQASWTQWKNLFAFEVYGENGSIQVHGLGGSYGPEKIVVAHRCPDGGKPKTREIDFPDGESTGSQTDVWANEWKAFVGAVLEPDRPGDRSSTIQSASAIDAWQALRIVEAAYASSRDGAAASPRRPGAVHPGKPPTATPVIRVECGPESSGQGAPGTQTRDNTPSYWMGK